MRIRISIVVFLFLCLFSAEAQQVRVISSNASSLVFEYTLQITDTTHLSAQRGNFVKLSALNLAIEKDFLTERYSLPYYEVNVGVPSEFGTTVSILNSEFNYLEGNLIPMDKRVEDLNSIPAEGFWKNEEFISTAVLGEYGLLRNMPVQGIRLYPIQYEPLNGRTKIFTKLVVQVNFGRGAAAFTKIKDERLAGAVINFDTARNWGIEKGNRLAKVESSVLANGTWYRFECPREGIYRITRNDLSSMGIDTGVDPRTIKIYSNGGYQLPESIEEERPEDLMEVAIYIEGENDGSFNDNDYILFYGRSTNFWEYSQSWREIRRSKNEFSEKNYYWITSGGTTGKRMSSKVSLNDQNPVEQNTTLAYKFMEENIFNIGETGRDWWGDKFTPTSVMHNYLTMLEGLVAGTGINYNFRLVNKGSRTIPLIITESDQEIYSRTMARVYGEYTIGIEHRGFASYEGALAENRSNLKFQIVPAHETDEVYIDYFEIEYTRELRAMGDSLCFFSPVQDGVIEYNLFNFSNSSMKVFDITDYDDVKQVTNASISGGNFVFQANESNDKINKYYGVTSTAYLTPVNIEQVENSDLRGITGGAEFIIITHPVFIEEAEELKDYRSSQSANSVSTIVVDVNDIYNEFSGGSLDPAAIRNFIQFAYENWNVKPFYVLLFGDGNYDYYDIKGLGLNFIPSYQLSYSLHEIDSYPSDDFYSRVAGSDLRADVAIGRLNIQTPGDAQIIINKIKEYEADPERSLWKNTITLVADDGPTSRGDDGSRHTAQSESLAEGIIPDYFISDKIYLAAYPTVITGSGRRKPDVNRAIVDAVNQGTLMLNFIGHGDPERWTHENVFTTDASIPQLQNEKYFFLTAATCDYGKFDQLEDQSATEIMMFMEGGAIGALTAVRPVYSNLNAALNETFYRNLFTNENNPYFCLGDAYLVTKQVRTGDNDEKFHLFADPTLRLNVPLMPVTVDSVNSMSLENQVQVKALGRVDIKGKVRDENGSQTNFSGESIISVFDSDKIIRLPEMNYQMSVQGGVIFKGRATVDNGEFRISFVVPKDISYADDNGRILAYIYDDEKDGLGFSRNIIVGGSDTSIENDGNGPEIEIFYDDFEFDNSYVVNPDFTLLVKLNDETGLNTTGTGVGHRLEGILNEDAEHPIDFSNYFVGDLDTGGRSGKVEYRFTNLAPGDYSLRIKAWDVFNNLSAVTSYFSVTDTEGLAVENVVNYPNPFSYNTTFTFQHNLSSAVNVKIRIYTIAGRLIKEIEGFDLFEKFVRLDWDGRDEDGNYAANGTYLYKVNVETIDGEYTKNVLGKLSIIR